MVFTMQLQAFRVGLVAPYSLAVAIWQSAAPMRLAAASIATSTSQGQVPLSPQHFELPPKY